MRDDFKQRRKVLLARLQNLTRRMTSIDAQRATPKTRDGEERAIEAEGDDVLEGFCHASEAEVAAIRAALTRMDQGEYGVCTSCGEAISADRLDVLPFTALCRICAVERG